MYIINQSAHRRLDHVYCWPISTQKVRPCILLTNHHTIDIMHIIHSLWTNQHMQCGTIYEINNMLTNQCATNTMRKRKQCQRFVLLLIALQPYILLINDLLKFINLYPDSLITDSLKFINVYLNSVVDLHKVINVYPDSLIIDLPKFYKYLSIWFY